MTQKNTTEQELLPCPFCGGVAVNMGLKNWGFSIECCNIGCDCELSEDSEESAIRAWNTRKGMIPVSALDGMVEKVADINAIKQEAGKV